MRVSSFIVSGLLALSLYWWRVCFSDSSFVVLSLSPLYDIRFVALLAAYLCGSVSCYFVDGSFVDPSSFVVMTGHSLVLFFAGLVLCCIVASLILSCIIDGPFAGSDFRCFATFPVGSI